MYIYTIYIYIYIIYVYISIYIYYIFIYIYLKYLCTRIRGDASHQRLGDFRDNTLKDYPCSSQIRFIAECEFPAISVQRYTEKLIKNNAEMQSNLLNGQTHIF